MEKKKAEKEDNTRRIAAYSSESDHATMMMNDLKARIKSNESKVRSVLEIAEIVHESKFIIY